MGCDDVYIMSVRDEILEFDSESGRCDAMSAIPKGEGACRAICSLALGALRSPISSCIGKGISAWPSAYSLLLHLNCTRRWVVPSSESSRILPVALALALFTIHR